MPMVQPWSESPSVEHVAPIYTLEAARALPKVDLLRTPLSKVVQLDSRPHRLFMIFMRKHFAKAGTLYRIGAVLGMIVILTPREIGIWFAAPAGLLTLPSWFMTQTALSIDMMAITIRQFEFWYFSVLNVVTWGVLASIYCDLRIMSLIGAFLGSQSIIFIDANFRTIVHAIKSSVVSVPAVLLVAVLAFIRRIDTDDSNFRVISLAGVRIELADICANSAATLAIFIARKAYNKRKLLLKKNHGLRTIRCVVFRASLVMQQQQPDYVVPKQQDVAEGSGSWTYRDPVFASRAAILDRCGTHHIDSEYNMGLRNFRSPASRISHSSPQTVQQVTLFPPKIKVVDVRRTLLHRAFRSRANVVLFCAPATSSLCRLGLMLSGAVSLVLTPCALLAHPTTTTPTKQTAIAVASLVSTVVASAPIVLNAQRDVLRALLHNFDFMFVSLQFAVAMLMLCDMTLWTWRSAAVLAWFIGFQTVLIADAVTPPVRRSFGLSKRHTVPTLALSLAAMITLVYALLFTETVLLADRTLLSLEIVPGRRVSMRSKSVLLNRLLTLVVWGLRMLWDAALGAEQELTFIRGSLDYYSPLEMFPPVSEVAITPLSIVPATKAAEKFKTLIKKSQSLRRSTMSGGRPYSKPRRPVSVF